jgi:hypothetical protein
MKLCQCDAGQAVPIHSQKSQMEQLSKTVPLNAIRGINIVRRIACPWVQNSHQVYVMSRPEKLFG